MIHLLVSLMFVCSATYADNEALTKKISFENLAEKKFESETLESLVNKIEKLSGVKINLHSDRLKKIKIGALVVQDSTAWKLLKTLGWVYDFLVLNTKDDEMTIADPHNTLNMKDSGKIVTMDFKEASLFVVLKTLVMVNPELNLLIKPGVADQKVSLAFEDISLGEALYQLSKKAKILVKQKGKVITVEPRT